MKKLLFFILISWSFLSYSTTYYFYTDPIVSLGTQQDSLWIEYKNLHIDFMKFDKAKTETIKKIHEPIMHWSELKNCAKISEEQFKEKTDPIYKEINQFIQESNKNSAEFNSKLESLIKNKLRNVLKHLCKKLNASAIFPVHDSRLTYIDPEYDITMLVIQELNNG